MFVQNKFVLQVRLNRFQCLVVVFSSILNLLKENTFVYRKKWYYFTKPITRSFKTVICYTSLKTQSYFIYLYDKSYSSFFLDYKLGLNKRIWSVHGFQLIRINICLLNIYDLRNSLDVSFVSKATAELRFVPRVSLIWLSWLSTVFYLVLLWTVLVNIPNALACLMGPYIYSLSEALHRN